MKKNNRWPKVIPWMTPNDFFHGDWVKLTTEKQRKKLGICGNRCCMVGWVGSVFADGESSPMMISDKIGEPGIKFIRKLIELYGSNYIPSYNYNLIFHLSDVFENESDNTRAAKIWNEAVEYFGYTETIYLDS